MCISIPLRPITQVYHVGSLDPRRRGEQYRTSQEGIGLSVSQCPRAWARIASLGEEVFELSLDATGSRPAYYVDIHGVGQAAIREMVDWAVESGFVEDSGAWRGWDWDADEEQWRYSNYGSREEAEEEVLFCFDEENLDDIELPKRLPRGAKGLVEQVALLRLTEHGLERTGGFGADIDATEFAVSIFAEDVLGQLDRDIVGVWWNDRLDPERLSAPRGVIFLAHLERFSKRAVSWQDIPNSASRRAKRETIEAHVPAAAKCAAGPKP